jgi:methanogenic corrinoid protein MtbC1
MLTVLMRRAGWRALFFGANLPLEDLASVVPDLKPDVLVLSVTMTHHLNMLQDQLTALRKLGNAPPVILGGSALAGQEHVAAQLRCQYLGDDMLAAISKMESVVAKLKLQRR